MAQHLSGVPDQTNKWGGVFSNLPDFDLMTTAGIENAGRKP
jgi:hypothetical protein